MIGMCGWWLFPPSHECPRVPSPSDSMQPFLTQLVQKIVFFETVSIPNAGKYGPLFLPPPCGVEKVRMMPLCEPARTKMITPTSFQMSAKNAKNAQQWFPKCGYPRPKHTLTNMLPNIAYAHLMVLFLWRIFFCFEFHEFVSSMHLKSSGSMPLFLRHVRCAKRNCLPTPSA